MLSDLVGATIDIPEQEYYRIFDNVDGFLTAQFLRQGENFEVKIRTLKGWTRRPYTAREFYDVGLAVDLTGPIDPMVLLELSGEPVFLDLVDSLETLPTGVWMWIYPEEGKTVKGWYRGFDGRYFLLTSKRFGRLKQVSVGDVERLKYRDPPVVHFEKDRRIFILSALAGMAVGSLWNYLGGINGFDARTSWLFRGGVAGLALSPYPVHLGRVQRAAVHPFKIEPEIRSKIGTYLYLTFGEL